MISFCWQKILLRPPSISLLLPPTCDNVSSKQHKVGRKISQPWCGAKTEGTVFAALNSGNKKITNHNILRQCSWSLLYNSKQVYFEIPQGIILALNFIFQFMFFLKSLSAQPPYKTLSSPSYFFSPPVDIRAIREHWRLLQRRYHGARRRTVQRSGLEPGIRQDTGGLGVDGSGANRSKDCLRQTKKYLIYLQECPHAERTVQQRPAYTKRIVWERAPMHKPAFSHVRSMWSHLVWM